MACFCIRSRRSSSKLCHRHGASRRRSESENPQRIMQKRENLRSLVEELKWGLEREREAEEAEEKGTENLWFGMEGKKRRGKLRRESEVRGKSVENGWIA